MEDETPAIQAIGFDEVDEIRGRFMNLSPYDPAAVSSLLKLEDVNFESGEREQLYCDAVSAKRYCLFNEDDGIAIRDAKEHGLGHLLNPIDPEDPNRDWIKTIWAILVFQDLGVDVGEPPWFERIGASRFAASSPYVLRAFEAFNKTREYAEQVKPFNFLLSVKVDPLGYPLEFSPRDGKKLHLVAPWEPDPRKWRDLEWLDVHSGLSFKITTSDTEDPGGTARVKTYRDIFSAYGTHPEPKSLAPETDQCEAPDEDF